MKRLGFALLALLLLAHISRAALPTPGQGADEAVKKQDDRRRLRALVALGKEKAAAKEFKEAEKILGEAAALSASLKDSWQQKQSLEGLGRIARLEGKRDDAIKYFRQAAAIKVSLTSVAALISELRQDKDGGPVAVLNRTIEDGLLVGERAMVIAYADPDGKGRKGHVIGTAEIIEMEGGKLAARVRLSNPQTHQVLAGDFVEAPAVLPTTARPTPLLRTLQNGLAFMPGDSRTPFITLQELMGGDGEQRAAEIYARMLTELRLSVIYAEDVAIQKGRYKGRQLFDVLADATEKDLLALFYYVLDYPNTGRGNFELWSAFGAWAQAGGPPGIEEITGGVLALKSIEQQREYLAGFKESLRGDAVINRWTNFVERLIAERRLAEAEQLARLVPTLGAFNADPELARQTESVSHFLIAKIHSAGGRHKESISEYMIAADAWQKSDLKNYASAIANIALEYRSLGQFKEDMEHHERAVKATEEYYRARPEEIDRLNWLRKHIGLAQAYYGISRYEDSLREYNRTLEIIGDEPGIELIPFRAAALDNIGLIHARRGEYKESIRFYERARSIRAKLDEPEAEATSLANIGSGHWNLGDYRTALDHYEKALFLRETTENRPGVAETLTNIGSLHWNLGDYDAAVKNYDRALATYAELGDAERESNVHQKIGSLRRGAGQYADALKSLGRALEIRKRAGKLDLVVATYNELGDTYAEQTDYEEARRCYEQVYELQQKLGNKAEEARALENLSFVYFWLQDAERSLAEAERALKMWQEVGDAKGIISALGRVGGSYSMRARWAESISHYRRALDLAVKTESRALEADAMIDLGHVTWSEGSVARALDLYRKALAIYEAMGDQGKQSQTRINISRALYALADYEGAEKEARAGLELALKTRSRATEASAQEMFSDIAAIRGDVNSALKTRQEILKIYQETRDEFGRARALAGLGALRKVTGGLKQALADHREALTMYQKLNVRPAVINEHINMALVYKKLRNYAEAIKHLNNALALERESPFPNGRLYALGVLGDLHAELASYDDALKCFAESIEIAKKIDDRYVISGLMLGQAWVHRHKGDYARAGELLNQAMASRKQLGPGIDLYDIQEELGVVAYLTKDYRSAAANLDAVLEQRERQNLVSDMWETLYYRGLVERDQGRAAEAIAYWARAVEVVEKLRDQAGDETAQARFQSDKNNLYGDLIDLLLKQQNCADCENRAWQFIARAKSSELATIFGSSFKQPRTSEERAVVSRAQTFQTRELVLRRQLDEERRKPAAERNQESVNRITAQLRAVQQEYERYTKSLPAEQKGLVQIEPEDFRQIQGSLEKGEVFIEPMLLADRIVIFAVRWGANVPLIYRETRVSESEVNDTLKRLRDALSDSRNGFGRVRAELAAGGAPARGKSEDPLTLCQRLYDWIIKPVLPEIVGDDVKTLIISPSGRLRYIPFATLHDGAQYLVERYQIGLLTRSGSISAGRARPIDPASMKLLAVSNPDPGQSPLPGADKEVDEIARIFSGASAGDGRARIFRHNEASKKNLMDALYDYEILHFATHGYLNSESPEQSYLLMAGPSDSRLTFDEIGQLEVGQTRLVTLSACQTALGERGQGQEIAGLAYGFEKAGAATVIASLWSVNDESTKELMVKFYSNLKSGMSKAEAMREAQIALMKNPAYRHPYYWAPFLVIGSWR